MEKITLHEEGWVMASRRKVLGKLCDVLNGKERGYIHREWVAKKGPGAKGFRNDPKKIYDMMLFY